MKSIEDDNNAPYRPTIIWVEIFFQIQFFLLGLHQRLHQRRDWKRSIITTVTCDKQISTLFIPKLNNSWPTFLSTIRYQTAEQIHVWPIIHTHCKEKFILGNDKNNVKMLKTAYKHFAIKICVFLVNQILSLIDQNCVQLNLISMVGGQSSSPVRK